MVIQLDVNKVVRELQGAVVDLQSGDVFHAIVAVECALTRIVSHVRRREVVVFYKTAKYGHPLG